MARCFTLFTVFHLSLTFFLIGVSLVLLCLAVAFPFFSLLSWMSIKPFAQDILPIFTSLTAPSASNVSISNK